MDWTKIIAEIQKHGYSQPQIAAICGCAQATVSDLASGMTKDPRHSLGQRLQELLNTCRIDAGEVPARRATDKDPPVHAKANGKPTKRKTPTSHREPRSNGNKEGR
jgi:transcriptional regulator with XRE-family HTH domain